MDNKIGTLVDCALKNRKALRNHDIIGIKKTNIICSQEIGSNIAIFGSVLPLRMIKNLELKWKLCESRLWVRVFC